ncbi:MAG: hypothetical protein ACKORB_05345 [Opitutia bacterium]
MPTATDEDPACPSGAEADSWIRRGTPCATRSSWEAPSLRGRADSVGFYSGTGWAAVWLRAAT